MLRFIKSQINNFIFSQPNASFAKWFQLVNKFYWKYPFSVSVSNRQTVLLSSLDVSSVNLEISKKIRISRYTKGIKPFLNKLTKQYFFDTIEFREGDTVIDCGANIGEVGLWLHLLDKSINVIAVEPEAVEAEACDANVYSGRPLTIRKALWKEEGELSFYSKNSSGDSSLFEQKGFEKKIKIQTTTIENLFKEKNIQHVRVLKLEAEGAEPEILIGAEKVLPLIDYIAVDCGPERGLSEEPTFMPVYNFLTERGFKLVDVKFDRIVALFKRNL